MLIYFFLPAALAGGFFAGAFFAGGFLAPDALTPAFLAGAAFFGGGFAGRPGQADHLSLKQRSVISADKPIGL